MSDGAFAARWRLSRADMTLVETSTAATRLGLAAQLELFRNDGVFPSAWSELGEEVRAWLAKQLGLAPSAGAGYAFEGRTRRDAIAPTSRAISACAGSTTPVAPPSAAGSRACCARRRSRPRPCSRRRCVGVATTA